MSATTDNGILVDDPLWYRDAVIYQTHVRAFFDSNGDGIGDFRGLTSKLRYLEELGVNTLWVLPFYPSPLKDDGYDIADYTGVHAAYGNIQDFTRFLREAHQRGLRVITELVINHTSDQHPWFRRARKAAAGSRERDFYVWSDTAEKYRSARVIFKDFEPSNWTMDPVAKAYFWHRFYAHQPDLNFDNAEVRRALFQVADFWLRRGVDGLRLDAVPYLYEREGTSCENLPQTHAFLKEFRAYIDDRHPNRMLLAEANQWPEDAAAYFGDGDECHMNFHFPIMPRMFMALRMEDRYPIVDILRQTPAIPGNCQWATFLRNHDELTLEMVTDRERDYMYQAYARDREMRINLGIRRRLAPLLNNDRRAIELMNGLLFSMPGSPVIYYGDEIGMGDNVYLGDRNGVRTPMQWSSDRNAGFSRANPQRLYLPVIIDPQFHYESVNVEAQENNPQSLLWWMRRLINQRKRFAALGRGSIEFLPSANHKVLSFLREHEGQRVLVVANLSRFAQQVELDLARFGGMAPVEVFGQNRFRPIGPEPYYLTLGPYGFHWFALEPAAAEIVDSRGARTEIIVGNSWEHAFEGRARTVLERALLVHLRTLPWFADPRRRLESVRILDVVAVGHRQQTAHVALAQAEYAEGSLELHALPLVFVEREAAQQIEAERPAAVVAQIRVLGKGEGLLYDALGDPRYAELVLQTILRRRRYVGKDFELSGALRPATEPLDEPLPPGRILKAHERRVSSAFGDKVVLKTYRKLDAGVNPDWELGRFLSDRDFAATSRTLGAVELRRNGHEPTTLAILREFVQHEHTAWQYTLDALGQFYERALTQSTGGAGCAAPATDLLALAARDDSPEACEMLGFYPTQAALLGRRTAELHLVLASEPDDAAFAPEPFTPFFLRSQFQGLQHLLADVFEMLRAAKDQLDPHARELAASTLAVEGEVRRRFRAVRDGSFASMRIRCHGNYHLGQILYTGKDFVITDFEGDPRQSLSERRAKYTALRDVVGIVRSLHQAAFEAMTAAAQGALAASRTDLEPWYHFWRGWVTAAFLRGYLAAARGAAFLPADSTELHTLWDVSLIEQSLVELRHHLDHRPEACRPALEGVMLGAGQTVPSAAPTRPPETTEG